MSNPTPALDRQAKRRLAIIRHVEQVTGNVALACRYYGSSRHAYYISGTAAPVPRASTATQPLEAAQDQPNATHTEVVEKICYLRQALPLRPREDRHVPQALPRHHDHPTLACGASQTG
jgi:hypothetical protein